MFFFHYTNKKGYDGMTGGGTPWNCEARQPQKHVWYSDQHQKAFYVTILGPFQLATSGKGGAIGSGASWGDHVLVFELQNVSLSDFSHGRCLVIAGTGTSKVAMRLLGHPLKFGMRGQGTGVSGDSIPLTAQMCHWAGEVANCSFGNGLSEKNLKSFYQMSTSKF